MVASLVRTPSADIVTTAGGRISELRASVFSRRGPWPTAVGGGERLLLPISLGAAPAKRK